MRFAGNHPLRVFGCSMLIASARVSGPRPIRPHLRAFFELERSVCADAVQTGTEANGFESARFDVFIDLPAADLPITRELRDGDVGTRMSRQVRQRTSRIHDALLQSGRSALVECATYR